MEEKIAAACDAVDDLITRQLNIVKALGDLIKQYMSNPDEVVNNIVNNKDLSFAREFENIQEGLTGTFTRNQAIEIGKNKLLEVFKRYVEEACEHKTNVNKIINSNSRVLQDRVNVTTGIVDLKLLNTRVDLYMKNSLTTEFMTRKIKSYVDDVKYEFIPASTPAEFLNNIREIFSLISVCDLSGVEEAWKKYEIRKAKLCHNYSQLGTDDYTRETLEIESIKDNKTSDELLKEYMQKYGVTGIEDTPATDILTTIINDMERRTNSLRENVVTINDKFSKYVENDDIVKDILSNITDEIVTPYVKGEMNTEEFTKLYADAILALDNFLILLKDITIVINNTYTTAYKHIEIFEKLYMLIEELGIRGTIPEAATNPEKEKEFRLAKKAATFLDVTNEDDMHEKDAAKEDNKETNEESSEKQSEEESSEQIAETQTKEQQEVGEEQTQQPSQAEQKAQETVEEIVKQETGETEDTDDTDKLIEDIEKESEIVEEEDPEDPEFKASDLQNAIDKTLKDEAEQYNKETVEEEQKTEQEGK